VLLVKLVAETPAESRQRDVVWQAGAAICKYGVPRIPGGFAAMALLGLPAILAIRYSDPITAACFALGASLLSMYGGALRPLTQMTVPLVSALGASGRQGAVEEHAAGLLKVGIALACLVTLLAQGLMPVVPWFFGEEFAEDLTILRWIAVAAIPYGIYVILRDFLDACETTALNTRNQLIAVGVLAALGMALRSPEGIALGVVTSQCLLAWLTWRHARVLIWSVPSTSGSDAQAIAPDNVP
jgi:O-antigen/teichoic acid export membrane protein